MPTVLVDAVCVLALVVMLAVAFLHPRGRVEAVVGLGAAAAVAVSGAVSRSAAAREVGHLLPVVAFLSAILVVAEICAAEGLFAAVGRLVARRSRGRAVSMLGWTFAAAALTTATLSLDATVVLLTPVVAAALGSGVRGRPLVYACVRLANSASLLLPVSNLTNLLALPSLALSFTRFAVVMAPVWVVVIAVEYVGHRAFFSSDLREVRRAEPVDDGDHLPRFPLVTVAVMLVGFAVASPLGVAPAWVAAAAAVVLAVRSLRRRIVTPHEVLGAAHLTFALFVLCLGVVVAGLSGTFLGDVVRHLVPGGHGLLALLAVAVLATVLANLVNNLPATLLLVPLVAPLGTTALLAALVGLNVGSGLTYTGSLANLLWRRSLVRHGTFPSGRTFHVLSAVLTPPALVVSVLVLWWWTGVVGT